MRPGKFKSVTLITCIFFAFAPFTLADEDQVKEKKYLSADEIAMQLRRSVTPLANINNAFEFHTFAGDQPGADKQTSFTYSIEPYMPFPLENGNLIIFRTTIPLLLDEPVFNPTRNGFDSKGPDLGDISFDLGYGNLSEAIGTYGLVGLFASVPTATNDLVGSQQFRLGPAVGAGLSRKWGEFGFHAIQSWNVGGSNKEDFSTTTLEYWYAFELGGGWLFGAAPTIEAVWEANSDNTWAVPVGIGVSKTIKSGSISWTFALEAHYYVVQPDTFGPEFLLEFDITPAAAFLYLK
jgi:hypothetical protein